MKMQRVLVIESKCSMEQAVDRLRGAISLAGSESTAASVVKGEVVDRRVRLMRTQRLGNSAFRPQFTGTLEATGSGCTLRGEFSLAAGTRLALLLFAISAILLTIGSGVAGLWTKDPGFWIIPAAGFLVLSFGGAIVRLAKVYYASDINWMSRFLAEALRPDPHAR